MNTTQNKLADALRLCERALADYGDRHHGGPKFDACIAARAALAEHDAAEPIRIVVTMEGGLIGGVFTNHPALVCLIDFDTEGADPDEYHPLPCLPVDGYPHHEEAGGWDDAFIRTETATVAPVYVAGRFAQAEGINT